MSTTSCRVRCAGALHTITLTARGALVLHRHDIRTERALVALGGEPCRCLQVLDAWRQRDRSKLPAALRPAMDAGLKLAKERVRSRSRDPLSVPFIHRVGGRVAEIVRRELASCSSYRRSQTSWAGGGHSVNVHQVLSDTKPNITGGSDRAWSENGKWSGSNSFIFASVPLAWLARVYRRGLAVIEGVFVLDVLGEDEKSYTVLAGKQGRGFDVAPARARVTRTAEGYTLRWEKGGK